MGLGARTRERLWGRGQDVGNWSGRLVSVCGKRLATKKVTKSYILGLRQM